MPIINDTSLFFEITFDDNNRVRYPMRPPDAGQMRYYDLCRDGLIAPMTPQHPALTEDEIKKINEPEPAVEELEPRVDTVLFGDDSWLPPVV